MSSLENLILQIKKKAQASHVVDCIINRTYTTDQLMKCFFSDDWILCQKASWPVTILADKKPKFVLPFLSQMIKHLDRTIHNAAIRNTIRTWQVLDIPKYMEGEVYERCFSYLVNPEYPVAIRVFSMTVCSNIAVHYPSLAQEITTIIEDHWDTTSAAWRSRGKKELKRLSRVI